MKPVGKPEILKNQKCTGLCIIKAQVALNQHYKDSASEVADYVKTYLGVFRPIDYICIEVYLR